VTKGAKVAGQEKKGGGWDVALARPREDATLENPEALLVLQELGTELRAALIGLPRDERRAMVLVAEGATDGEIARAMHVSPTTARRLRQQGQNRLGERLEAAGYAGWGAEKRRREERLERKRMERMMARPN